MALSHIWRRPTQGTNEATNEPRSPAAALRMPLTTSARSSVVWALLLSTVLPQHGAGMDQKST